MVEAPNQLVTVADPEQDLHRAVAGAELREQGGKKVVPGTDDTDVEHSAFHAAQDRELLARHTHLGEHRRARAQQRRSGAREMELAAETVEERLARLALKLRDLDRHCGRREVQLCRRAGKGEVRRGAHENLKLAQRGVTHRAIDKNYLTLM